MVELKLLEIGDIHNLNGLCRRIKYISYNKLLWHINQVDKIENTVLKVLERENINQKDKLGITTLDYTNEINMKNVINRINELNKE